MSDMQFYKVWVRAVKAEASFPAASAAKAFNVPQPKWNSGRLRRTLNLSASEQSGPPKRSKVIVSG
jgi:hypothetical protein